VNQSKVGRRHRSICKRPCAADRFLSHRTTENVSGDAAVTPAADTPSTREDDFAACQVVIFQGKMATSAQMGAIRQAIANTRERRKGPQRASEKTG
jgi:hypothetical protein